MNYMKQVATMLDVELDEEFNILSLPYKYKLTEQGLERYDDIIRRWIYHSHGLRNLLNGEYEIVKLPKPILDEVEKEYLSHIIKPFKDKITYIRKNNYLYNTEYIAIGYYENCKREYTIEFPEFEKGTMYKGMELGKKYTLEDLEL